MQPSPEIIHKIKTTSPHELKEQGNRIYATKNLNEFMTSYELRQVLYTLAEAHLLSMPYISANAEGNAGDAIQEVYGAVNLGILIQSDPNAPTMKMYYHINPDADEKVVEKWLHPAPKPKQPRIKKYVARPPKHYSSKRHKPTYHPDPRGESNRIANDHPKQKYESITGDMSPNRNPDKENYRWSDKTSIEFHRGLESSKIRKNISNQQ